MSKIYHTPITQKGENEWAIRYGFIQEELSSLLGETLTIVDSSTEGQKNEAMKSLVKDKFHDKMNKLLHWCRVDHDPNKNGKVCKDQFIPVPDEMKV